MWCTFNINLYHVWMCSWFVAVVVITSVYCADCRYWWIPAEDACSKGRWHAWSCSVYLGYTKLWVHAVGESLLFLIVEKLAETSELLTRTCSVECGICPVAVQAVMWMVSWYKGPYYVKKVSVCAKFMSEPTVTSLYKYVTILNPSTVC